MNKLYIVFVSIITGIIFLLLWKKFFSSKEASVGGNNDLINALRSREYYLVDVRTPKEFNSGSAIGSVNIPLNDIPSNLDSFRNKKNIILFCASGFRSGEAKKILEKNGFEKVINGKTLGKVNDIMTNIH